MADIPPIHVCHSLHAENDALKGKYDRLKKKYKELNQNMLDMKETLLRMKLEKEYRQRDPEEIPAVHHLSKDNTKKKESNEVKEGQSTNEKLLVLNNQLLKQFEKGNKQLKTSERKMMRIEGEKEKSKNDLFEASQQIEYLKKQIVFKDEQYELLSSKMKKTVPSKQQGVQLTNLKKENKKLSVENEKLKTELKGLDATFFDEIEDMKYALQQSAKLNTEYERALRRLCKQFGLNYTSALRS